MGSAVSAGANNDELTSNLCEANYITSSAVEQSFRVVDRGNYFPGDFIEDAYRDLAWKQGNIHISAPCIYSEVVEALEINAGMSFLNLGSGTGYLSTLVGLMLGPFGSNHGVEIHEDVVKYACEKLDVFIEQTPSRFLAKFCRPTFVVGNCLLIDPEYRQYDRIYCGAGCPSSEEQFVKSLLKPDGILVMPVKDNLVKYKRLEDEEFEKTILLPVQFASLVDLPSDFLPQELIRVPSQPLSLKEICRFKLVEEFSDEWLMAISKISLPLQLADFLDFKLEPPHQPSLVMVSE